MCGEVSARVRRLQPPELECEEKRPRGPEFDVPLAHEVLEASLGVSQHVLEIPVVRVVDSAAAAEHDLGPQPDVELAPATLGAHRDAQRGRPEALPDAAAAQARQRLPDEALPDELDDAELDARVDGDGLRLEETVARSEPALVAADRDFVRVVGRAPAEPHPALQVGAAAPLGGVGLRGDQALRGTGGWRKDCSPGSPTPPSGAAAPTCRA